MSSPLRPRTLERLHFLFDEVTADQAEQLLVEKCGRNLPLMGGKRADAIERIRIAAIKVSNGDLEALQRAVDLANIDWRDLLVEAGFAHDVEAHKHWHPGSGSV